ncbi:DUF4652 domain-containing protein [Bacillus paranthracis]|uniref:DUF4652 domain-containing protein n=1 Tax=Bacillus cereus group TaxID=86661 RepID=UPI00187A014C|nr:DUF4652 domain-containing protein [Bacillus paranthracis]MBE7117659.1 DUF4652 domain-containing protein [Bacillus paranthracis]MBE7134425.1 DUF4652 domain-containing protein [Bacillus paranthracis]MBE7155912.1 DUF4652 domain-containing protein [Bacillus paranthracis]MCU4849903.1 DUF4652 domain-containing protein [Bacillus paranthracis]MDK7541804.1 DUF4652 domain-containing protein [Bacillus paranthracis]
MKNRYLNTLLLGIIAVLIAIFVLGYFNIISLPQKKSVVAKPINTTKETNQQNSNKEKQESKKNNELDIDETKVSLLTKNGKGETIPLGKSDLGTTLDYEISPSGDKIILNSRVLADEPGKLSLYDFKADKQTVVKIDSKLNNSQTCKSVTWIDNNHLLLVIGGAAGSANHGGDLYTYNVQTKEFKLFKKHPKNISYTKVVGDMESFYFIGIQYTDDNYNKYTGYVETVSTNEIKNSL